MRLLVNTRAGADARSPHDGSLHRDAPLGLEPVQAHVEAHAPVRPVRADSRRWSALERAPVSTFRAQAEHAPLLNIDEFSNSDEQAVRALRLHV
jgi:hypothetical protein